MTANQLKGALLEYLIRKLLHNCGFISAKPDGHYIFESGAGLFFINGKGAAHDADVLMEPPIQLPFTYPSRLLFECKAHNKTTGLDIVRNALGLRYDINEFEIVTDQSIQERKNNRRSDYAISDRVRCNYQVGIASVEDFSAPAFEFAANNKIPLLSLRWFLPDSVCNTFHEITPTNLVDNVIVLQKIYNLLKSKNFTADYSSENELKSVPIIKNIVSEVNNYLKSCMIGLTETGDLLFLFADNNNINLQIPQRDYSNELTAQIHYYQNKLNVWELDITDCPSQFKFFVPDRIMKIWKDFSLDKKKAIDLKAHFFSRFFIFNKQQDKRKLPFIVVNIDREWLDRIKED